MSEWDKVLTKKAFYDAPTKPPLCAILKPVKIGRVTTGLASISEEEQEQLEKEFQPPCLGGISSSPETEPKNSAESTNFGPDYYER